MDTHGANWFTQSLARLTEGTDLRAWSVIVTVFGDLAGSPGDRLSGPALTRIVGPLGIRPEAMRVALHRLRGDGWVESVKTGRSRHYSLTTQGRAESEAARGRIYATAPRRVANWQIAVFGPGTGTPTATAISGPGTVEIGPGIYLLPDERDVAGALCLRGSDLQVPDWARRLFAPTVLADGYARLEIALEEVGVMLSRTDTITALQVASLRVAAVHRWRRLLLHHPDLPPGFFPADWRGETCRVAILELLDRVGRPSVAELNAL